ncbi:hypothetical protein ACM26V_16915 [Salipaludibacillus sp. HK11]|uniref:hypothetical protein n=1 Tax=Salipaludibacillus sp. HK11 TaxID=3394320 RepID=UPI0039FD2DA3
MKKNKVLNLEMENGIEYKFEVDQADLARFFTYVDENKSIDLCNVHAEWVLIDPDNINDINVVDFDGKVIFNLKPDDRVEMSDEEYNLAEQVALEMELKYRKIWDLARELETEYPFMDIDLDFNSDSEGFKLFAQGLLKNGEKE